MEELLEFFSYIIMIINYGVLGSIVAYAVYSRFMSKRRTTEMTTLKTVD